MNFVNITNFKEEVLDVKDKIVVVDFYADWCGPCLMLGPILEEIEQEENIKLCKANVDFEFELADKFNVTSIPYVVVFKDGKIKNMFLGYRSKDEVKKIIFSDSIENN